jgi:hypothetical protein
LLKLAVAVITALFLLRKSPSKVFNDAT